MSTDAKVAKKLMQTLQDGRDGYAKGADKLAEGSKPELAATFRRYSHQRATFYDQLQQMAENYGDDIDESGSFVAILHRGWMTMKDAVTGSGPEAILDTAEQGEDHAVGDYKEALASDISADLRSVVERQNTAVRVAHDEIRILRNTHKS
jgi:uncharacterized protein (TIGR02284 family)